MIKSRIPLYNIVDTQNVRRCIGCLYVTSTSYILKWVGCKWDGHRGHHFVAILVKQMKQMRLYDDVRSIHSEMAQTATKSKP